MEGPNQEQIFDESNNMTHHLSGILPRTAVFLFQELKRLENKLGSNFSLEISAIEIYCDKLRDLFSDSDSQGLDIELAINPKDKKVFVKGQTWKKLTEVSEFLALIKVSSGKRQFG